MTIRKKELKELKKSELKDMCKELGLQVSGNKKVLVDRILRKEYKGYDDGVIARVFYGSADRVDIIKQKRSFDNLSVTITLSSQTGKHERITDSFPGLNPEEAVQKVSWLVERLREIAERRGEE